MARVVVARRSDHLPHVKEEDAGAHGSKEPPCSGCRQLVAAGRRLCDFGGELQPPYQDVAEVLVGQREGE